MISHFFFFLNNSSFTSIVNLWHDSYKRNNKWDQEKHTHFWYFFSPLLCVRLLIYNPVKGRRILFVLSPTIHLSEWQNIELRRHHYNQYANICCCDNIISTLVPCWKKAGANVSERWVCMVCMPGFMSLECAPSVFCCRCHTLFYEDNLWKHIHLQNIMDIYIFYGSVRVVWWYWKHVWPKNKSLVLKQ